MFELRAEVLRNQLLAGNTGCNFVGADADAAAGPVRKDNPAQGKKESKKTVDEWKRDPRT